MQILVKTIRTLQFSVLQQIGDTVNFSTWHGFVTSTNAIFIATTFTTNFNKSEVSPIHTFYV